MGGGGFRIFQHHHLEPPSQENLEQGLPLRDRSGYTDTPPTTEGKALEHETERAILVYPTPSQESLPNNPGKSNSFKHEKQTNRRYVKLP